MRKEYVLFSLISKILESKNSNQFLSAVYALVAGLFAFFSILGWRPLLPENIAWLEKGDPATFYLGWEFYRNAQWAFPVGLNLDYGLELSSSVLFSDSIPLFAIFFKTFSFILPEVFQYFGFWLLLCLILQFWFAFILVGLFTENNLVKFLGAMFFVFAPPLIWRTQFHFALVAHFLILAALYLILKENLANRTIKWATLISIAALIHPYLLAMAGLIWITDCADRFFKKKLPFRKLFIELITVFTLVLFICWQVGYFLIGNGLAEQGYGYYRMNMLSIFSAEGYSYLLPSIPMQSGDYEGINFLGIGIFFLIFCLFLKVFFASRLLIKSDLIYFFKNRLLLILLVVFLTIFSVTHQIGISSFTIGFDLPKFVLDVANIFRASGRMFWPVYYLVVLAVIYLVIRNFSTKLSISLLGLALLIQYADTSNAWSNIRVSNALAPSTTWGSTMRGPFWDEVAAKYSKVKVLLPKNFAENWKEIAYFANINNLPTDAIYLGRVDTGALKQAQQRAKEMMASGKFDSDTVYFIEKAAIKFDVTNPYELPLKVNTKTDLLAHIDGYYVLAPGWKACMDCSVVAAEISAEELFPPAIDFDRQLFFGGKQSSSRYLHGGWSSPEIEGVWSNGQSANLVLPLKNPDAKKIVFNVFPLLSTKHTNQAILVKINGIEIPPIDLTINSGNRFELEITDKIISQIKREGGRLYIQFRFLNAARPQDLGIGSDTRELSIRLQSLTVLK